ncbi:MAG TPA: hypothetical protein PLO23_01185, partial [Alphaproteobacteria bacterium]|nr:hypothetical protein [Alphaproteobacteria bacterium]
MTMAACPPVYAETTQPPLSSLRSLAQEFVQKMKKGFQEADDYYRTYYAGDLREQESFVDIPDGEMLLLQIELPKRMRLPDPVMAIKQGRDVMISLSDLSTIARFKSEVLPEARRAEGWFIRQEKNFNLDVAAGTAQVAGENYTLKEGDVLEQDNDIFVRADALSSWMGFDMEVSLQRQNIKVTNGEKWPVQEMLDRRNRKPGNRQLPPSMPRLEDPYSIVGPANIDLNLRQQYRKPADGETVHTTTYSLRRDGDLAAHTATAVLGGTREDPISNARLTMSRESDQPDLLGPLGARKYEFGDIIPSRVRLGGPTKAGLGARATNKAQNTTTDTTTRVEVEGTPGWDIEIFRGSQLLGTGTVDESGRFVFEDVLLVPGDNLFRIVQYGPFGEIVENNQSFYAGFDKLNKDGFSYDVSLTAANTQFYDTMNNETEDHGAPHL